MKLNNAIAQDDFFGARRELNEAEANYREKSADVIRSMRDMSVAEAYHRGLIRFNFKTGHSWKEVTEFLS